MIDTHCHIDDPQYQPLAEYLRAQYEGGVEAIIVPATTAASSKEVLELCSISSPSGGGWEGALYAALGLHPEEVGLDYASQLDDIESYSAAVIQRSGLTVEGGPTAQRSPIKAIGEIGLDYHFSTQFKTEQQSAFRRQLGWAKQWDLPVIIHSRDATEDCLRILREEDIHWGVMHCFSGSHETAEQVLKQGLYLGIGGVITFKNCKLREALVGIPLERLVLETDGPYMAPVPHRGERNESRWMHYVMEVLAEVYQCPIERIDEVTTANAKALFRLK